MISIQKQFQWQLMEWLQEENPFVWIGWAGIVPIIIYS